jgi:hypothetical protein
MATSSLVVRHEKSELILFEGLGNNGQNDVTDTFLRDCFTVGDIPSLKQLSFERIRKIAWMIVALKYSVPLLNIH